ncbi:MAG: hypothetical protein U0930_16700 [Pirellulales bacterium]
MSQRSEITISQILRWTAFIAVYLTAAGHLINSSRSIGVSAIVATSFIVLDVYRRHSNNAWLAVSYFCCGLAWSVVAMLVTLLCWPEPTPPTPPMPFLFAIAPFLSGQWLSELANGLARVMAEIMLYFAFFTLATVTSTALAIPHFRKRSGWKIVLANIPGLLFICFVVAAIILSAIVETSRP